MSKRAYVQERLAQIVAAPKVEPEKAPTPVFNPDGPWNMLSNGQRIQGKWVFSPSGEYVSEADRAFWLPDLTPEQERERQQYLARQKAKAAARAQPRKGAPPPVPQKVIDNARENAEALRAEVHAE